MKQVEKDKYCIISEAESETTKLIKTKVKFVVVCQRQGQLLGELDEGGQTSSYKIN